MRDVRQHGTRVLADRRTHLMGTSGIWRTWVDINAECVCGWAGDTEGCEDLEDMTFTWTCPDCGEEHPEVTSE